MTIGALGTGILPKSVFGMFERLSTFSAVVFNAALGMYLLKDMVKRYNEIFREQMPNITPHVCRHTYCSIQARAGMYPKTLQYLMGHSDIGVTMNTYTHLGLEDALEEVGRMQELENARKEQEKLAGKKEETKVSKRMFRAG